MQMQVQMLQHDAIEPDPRNPRQVFDEAQLDELANDIAVNGMLQPITVRPHPEKPGAFMLIFGERRWRACARVDVDPVPAIVREVDDLQALELQIAENNKRADVHPLEEADAYRRLREEHGRDVDEIADLCGKSKAYIYAAMKLCALVDTPRKAFLDGKLDKSRALLIARLPESQQTKATEMILAPGYDDEIMSFREAQQCIRQEFMLRLADAPFDVEDTQLVAEAGSCGDCEKRTGNQRELFTDLVEGESEGGADICTDSTCYRNKVDVHWARLKTDAEAKGRKVLDGTNYRNSGGTGDKEHLALDEHVYDFDVRGEKTYRELLGKSAEDAVTTLARTERGEIRELISRSDLPALLKAAGLDEPEDESQPAPTTRDYEREQKEARELATTVTRRAREAVLAKLDDLESAVLWRFLVRLAARVANQDALREIAKLHEIEHEKTSLRAAVIATVDGMPVRAQRDLTVELLLAEGGNWREPYDDDPVSESDLDFMSGLDHAGAVLGIDVPAIADKAKSDLATLRAQKAKKKS